MTDDGRSGEEASAVMYGESVRNPTVAGVSVIIINWNSSVYLKRCLSSLTVQTIQPVKIIVIDNGGTDHGLFRLQIEYPDIEWINLEKNIGFAAANNLGARRAEGSDWIALLNPDAFPEPEWIAHLLIAAQQHPRYSFFGSEMVSAADPNRLDGIGDVYHTSGLVWRHKHGSIPCRKDRIRREIFSPCAAAALYRLDAFLDAGGFDEHYFCYSEDVDLGFRLRLRGHRCLHVPDAVVRHVGSAVTGRFSDFSVYYGHRNLVWTYLKNMPFPLFLFYLPQHIFLNIFAILWFSLKGRAHLILKAKWDAVKDSPLMWRRRRQIQAERKTESSTLRKCMARGIFAVLKRR